MLLFRFCFSQNIPHPSLLLEKLSPRQVIESLIAFSLEPIGDLRGDLRLQSLLQIIGSQFSKTIKPSSIVWPYFDKAIDIEEALDMLDNAEETSRAVRAKWKQEGIEYAT